jgi:hypothetical protein
VSKDPSEKPVMPEYWKSAMETFNEASQQERDHYESLKNQLDIVVQHQTAFFNVNENNFFVNYIVDENFEDQGVKVRCKFTDTVADMKKQIAE